MQILRYGFLAILLFMCAVVPAQQKSRSPEKRLRNTAQNNPANSIFIFHTDEFWLNLHHFLYVLGRAQNKTADASREAVIGAPADQDKGFASLTTAERDVWNEAVSGYAATLSKKDLVFDDPLPALTKALSQAGEARSLTGAAVDAETAAVLQRAEPIYRKAWWPAHQSANRAWLIINSTIR